MQFFIFRAVQSRAQKNELNVTSRTKHFIGDKNAVHNLT